MSKLLAGLAIFLILFGCGFKPIYKIAIDDTGIAGYSMVVTNQVAREVIEEVNVSVKNIKYFGSQPWPFPSQLMLGYFCEYESGEIKIEEAELEDAKWFKIDDLPNVPPKLSISGQLISSYLEDRSKL